MKFFAALTLFPILLGACGQGTPPANHTTPVDLLIRGGQVFDALPDGTLTQNDVGIDGDTIVFVGDASVADVAGETDREAIRKAAVVLADELMKLVLEQEY